MRHLLLASLAMAAFACVGCASAKPDANTMATPRKRTALFACPVDGPCLARAEDGAMAR